MFFFFFLTAAKIQGKTQKLSEDCVQEERIEEEVLRKIRRSMNIVLDTNKLF